MLFWAFLEIIIKAQADLTSTTDSLKANIVLRIFFRTVDSIHPWA
jgi:hypothetical protein